MKIFHCSSCNRTTILPDDQNVIPNCCKKPMDLLVANNGVDDKHTPVVAINGNKVTVTVGKVAHPMEHNKHWINWICLDTNKGYLFKELFNKPEAEFTLGLDQKVITAYAYCNVHGLWVNKI